MQCGQFTASYTIHTTEPTDVRSGGAAICQRISAVRPRSHVSVFDRPGADRTGESTTRNFITSPVLTGRSNLQAVVHAQWYAMDRNSIIALFLLYRHRKRGRNRLHWVHPEIKKKNREEFGAFYTLFGKLRDDANSFLKLISNLCFIFRRNASPFEGESSAS